MEISLTEENGETHHCMVSEEDYHKIVDNHDYELATKTLQTEIERKNRLLAFRFLKDQTDTTFGSCSKPSTSRSALTVKQPISKPQPPKSKHLKLNINIPKTKPKTSTPQISPSYDDNSSPMDLQDTDDLFNNRPFELNDDFEEAPGDETFLGVQESLEISNRWTDSETKKLIEAYRSQLPKFKDKKFKPKAIFAEIAKKFERFSADQVETKIKNLKKTYKTIHDNNKKTGRGRITWPYFDLLNEIFQHYPENEPLSIASDALGFRLNEENNPDASSTQSSKSSEETPRQDRTPVTRRSTQKEPDWFKEYRKEIGERHNERMALQREFLDVFKNWTERQ